MVGRFDAIVVGAGISGSLAAHVLRRKDRSILLIEPSVASPLPMLPGGIAWRADLSRALPDGTPRPPIDRRIVERRMAALSPEASFSVDFRDMTWDTTGHGGRVVERAAWRAWGVGEAPGAGITLWKEAPVEGFILDRAGRVAGVRAGGKSAEASVTLVQDPSALSALSRTGVDLGRRGGSGPGPETVVESVHALPSQVVTDRFGGAPGLGFTIEAVLGLLPEGTMALGYAYPGASSVHTGVVVHASSASQAALSPEEVARRFEAHSAIRPFVRGASSRVVTTLGSSRGTSAPAKLYGDGLLIIGDAAQGPASSGAVLRGADALLATALAAAETAGEAIDRKDPTGRVLSRYVARLRGRGVLPGLGRAEDRLARVKWNPRLHRAYPALVSSLFRRMMTENGQPKEHTRDMVKAVLKGSGIPYTALARDTLAIVGSL